MSLDIARFAGSNLAASTPGPSARLPKYGARMASQVEATDADVFCEAKRSWYRNNPLMMDVKGVVPTVVSTVIVVGAVGLALLLGKFVMCEFGCVLARSDVYFLSGTSSRPSSLFGRVPKTLAPSLLRSQAQGRGSVRLYIFFFPEQINIF